MGRTSRTSKNKIIWVKRSTHPIIKSNAAQKGLSIADYIDKLVQDQETEMKRSLNNDKRFKFTF